MVPKKILITSIDLRINSRKPEEIYDYEKH